MEIFINTFVHGCDWLMPFFAGLFDLFDFPLYGMLADILKGLQIDDAGLSQLQFGMFLAMGLLAIYAEWFHAVGATA